MRSFDLQLLDQAVDQGSSVVFWGSIVEGFEHKTTHKKHTQVRLTVSYVVWF